MKATKIVGGLLVLGLSGLGAAPSQALVLSATYSGAPLVVDGNSDTVPLKIEGPGIVRGVSVVLEFIKCRSTRTGDIINSPGVLELDPSDPKACLDSGDAAPGEIEFLLSSPSGTGPIPLISGEAFGFPGSYVTSGSGFITVNLLDDPNVGFVGDSGYANEVSGINPAFPLAFFTLFDELAEGIWELTMTDTSEGDPLGLYRVTLNVTVDDPQTSVPEPGTLALLGLGLAGLGALKRRR